jgi:uncharacterized membrane protein
LKHQVNAMISSPLEDVMAIWIAALLIGMVCGLRAFTGIAAVSWAARYHRLDLEDTHLAFLGYMASPYLFSALALFEFVSDQLPSTPSRKVPQQFIPRVLLGCLSGAAIGSSNQQLFVGLVAAFFGAILGTFGGAWLRSSLAALFGKDMPAAFLEDAVAIGIATATVVNL